MQETGASNMSGCESKIILQVKFDSSIGYKLLIQYYLVDKTNFNVVKFRNYFRMRCQVFCKLWKVCLILWFSSLICSISQSFGKIRTICKFAKVHDGNAYASVQILEIGWEHHLRQ